MKTILGVALALTIAGEAASWIWIGTRDPAKVAIISLQRDRLETVLEFEPIEFEGSAADKLLDPDRAVIGTIGGVKPLSLVYLEYDPGNPNWWKDLYKHSPDRCMGSAGVVQEGVVRERLVTINGEDLLFHGYQFRATGFSEQRLFLYKCVWLKPDVVGNTASHIWDLRAKSALATGSSPSSRLMIIGLRHDDEPAAWSEIEPRIRLLLEGSRM